MAVNIERPQQRWVRSVIHVTLSPLHLVTLSSSLTGFPPDYAVHYNYAGAHTGKSSHTDLGQDD